MSSKTLEDIGIRHAQLNVSTQRIRAFGAREPLQTLGRVTVPVSVHGACEIIDFNVVAEPEPTVIGRSASERLGVLRVGPDVLRREWQAPVSCTQSQATAHTAVHGLAQLAASTALLLTLLNMAQLVLVPD
jgi:hypothetical protein